MIIKLLQGLTPYQTTVDIMQSIVTDMINKKKTNTALLVEHHPIYTVGYTTYEECINKYGNKIMIDGKVVDILKSERGGKLTYHGPGQRVCYLLIDLKELYNYINLQLFLNDIHSVIINSLKFFNIDGIREREYPGIWIQNGYKLSKIAAIGIKIKSGISYHGIAININTDMRYFESIIPCGIADSARGVTSLQELLGYKIDMNLFDQVLKSELIRFFYIKGL